MVRPPAAQLPLGQAAVLGLLHGPAELLPISSSGHITAIPWLLGWDYGSADPEVRKSFEVALHAGTAAALLITLREEVREALDGSRPRLATLIALSFVPPALAGYLLEAPIERRLGRPGSVAAGLIAGSIAMAWADRSPASRDERDAGPSDALWLGVAQACALVPGVSRNGATLAAARWRGFSRSHANLLSRHVALPIIAAATGRQLVRLQRGGIPRGAAGALATGASAAFASTLGSTWLIDHVERDRSLLPYALYRTVMAGAIVRRMFARRSEQCSTMQA